MVTGFIIWHDVIGLEFVKRTERMILRCISMVYLPHGKYIDIRVGLFIVSMDHVLLVYM